MMTQQFLQKLKSLFQPDQYAGLSWELRADGGTGQLVILQKAKKEITTSNTSFDLENLDKIASAIPKGIPVILNIQGKGILYKTLQSTVANESQLLQQVLPNAKANQFYVQQTPMENGVLASIIRRDSMDSLLAQLKKAEIWVTGVSLGPVATRYIYPFMRENSVINLPDYQLEFNEQGQLTTFQVQTSDEQYYSLGEEQWPNKSLTAYAAAFCGIMQIPTGLNTDQLQFQQEEFFYRQVFEKGKKVALGFILVVLLLNTFAYYVYKDKNNKLQGQLVQTKAVLSELDSLKVKVNQQQDLFKTTGINQQSQTSFYADRIGATLPDGLQLTALKLFPMDGKERDYEEESLRRYRQNEIRIKGVCKSSLTYNQWIKELAALSWVKEARHLNYKDLSKKRGSFELQLLIGPSQ